MSGEQRNMAEETPEKQDADKFVEIEGVKYKEDPENDGQAILGDDGKLVLYEEEKAEGEETPNETEEEKVAREKKEAEEEEKKDPPTRKSVKDHIIERKQKKIDKLEKKKEEGGNDDDGDDDKVGDHEVTTEGQKAIDKAIQKGLKPVLQSIRTTSDEQELANVLAKYPMAKDMEKQIRKYMDHDAYKDVSIEFIFLGLANKKIDLQKKRSKADEDAKADITGGHGKRKKKEAGPIPDVRDYTDKQIGELVDKVNTGQV